MTERQRLSQEHRLAVQHGQKLKAKRIEKQIQALDNQRAA